MPPPAWPEPLRRRGSPLEILTGSPVGRGFIWHHLHPTTRAAFDVWVITLRVLAIVPVIGLLLLRFAIHLRLHRRIIIRIGVIVTRVPVVISRIIISVTIIEGGKD